MKLADLLLRETFEEVGLPVPDWVDEWGETMNIEDAEEDQFISIMSVIIDALNEAYKRRINRLPPSGEEWACGDERKVINLTSLPEKAADVIASKEISWIIYNKDDDWVALTTGVLKELRRREGLDLTLKSVAQVLGWEYAQLNIWDGGRRRNLRVAKAPYKQFRDQLEALSEGRVKEHSLDDY